MHTDIEAILRNQARAGRSAERQQLQGTSSFGGKEQSPVRIYIELI